MEENNKTTIVNRAKAKIKNAGIRGLIFSAYKIGSYKVSTKITTGIYNYFLNNCGNGTKIEKHVEIFHPKRISLGRNVLIEHHSVLNASTSSPISAIIIGDNSSIRKYSILNSHRGTIKIGSWCNINPHCMINGEGGVRIGDYVLIASGSAIIAEKHSYSDVSTPIEFQHEYGKGINIGNDVLIGFGVKILDGVTIGTGSVIGAGAVVTNDIPPFSVAVGVPAKVIKKRK